ncbi:MAG: class I SAM-dependent methyltransferase [Armatimonadetes bacterium]|nr:class I SAM-dependent methyltransferase [Akkermansiaceae bacterium]
MLKKSLDLYTNLFRITLRNPRDLQHVIGVARWAAGEIADSVADTRSIPSIDVLDICPGTQRWTLQSFPRVGASVSPMECAGLAALSHLVGAKKVFEFGTYKGVSTTQLALNVGEGGMVFTLDLPEDHPAYSLPIPKQEEQQIANEGSKGILIPRDLLGRVTFLSSDSAKFDERPYLNTMDLVFVDGAHSYEYVKNDTEKGWKMLRPGGVIAWHDCVASHRDVVKYIKESNLDAKLIAGTTLAFAIK